MAVYHLAWVFSSVKVFIAAYKIQGKIFRVCQLYNSVSFVKEHRFMRERRFLFHIVINSMPSAFCAILKK